ncbi:MAG: phosphatidylinositol-specific phospholipase C/glycerophosphodiester phosphodiesterase family protein [Bacteroidota bacterium]
MNKIVAIFLFFIFSSEAFAQPSAYTPVNLHSHNDYEKAFPYWEAYNQGYGSIEADIFLKGNNLIIAHDTNQLKMGRTLDSFYLQPLQQCILKNNGYPYADKSKLLQLLIDIKTDSFATVNRLVEKLQAYPTITSCAGVKIVITGNRPAITAFAGYPSYIYFDGELHIDYPAKALGKIEMLSDNFHVFSHWNGIDTIPAADMNTITALIEKAHKLHKKVRFWNAPDIINSWNLLMKMGVDYINTDHITGAATYLNELGKKR